MAASLAKMMGSEVISADSRQFYKEMSIGTAVPTAREMLGVPHHFIQHLSIHQGYNAGQFERDALELLEQLFSTNELLFLVGGSGLYVDAVVHGLDSFPEVSEAVREQVRATYHQSGLEPLKTELKETDPETYAQIDLENPQRVLRAIEVYRSSGRPFSYFKGQPKAERPFRTTFIGLKATREMVYKRINRRVDQMMAAGLKAEARFLYPYRHLNALQTVGYKELFAWIEGKATLEEAVSEIKKNTRRFAKRQDTWFRKNQHIHWFDHTTTPE